MPLANANGVDIRFRDVGEGFPIVLIHGYTGNSRNWALTAPPLAHRFRVISVDLRGHGLSAKPVSEDAYALEAMASDVYELLKNLEVSEYALVGHSMGGMVSQLLILEHPAMVRALVLVDTAAEVPKGLLYEERLKQRKRLIEMAETEGMEAVFEEQLRVTPIPDAFKSNPQFIETWREQFLLTSREAYIACANEMSSLSGSELVIIPGAGHGPQMETPGEFNRLLLGFLSKVPQTSAV